METLDPRQIEFLKYYLDPKSKTFSNALQSGLRAGYSQEYSENITYQMPDWLSENLGDLKLVNKALKNLDELLDGEDNKIRADLTKFTLERLNKKKFSPKSEIDVNVTNISTVLNEIENGQATSKQTMENEQSLQDSKQE